MIKQTSANNKTKYFIFIITFLAAQSFFNPFGIISPRAGKFCFYIMSAISVAYALRSSINLRHIDYPNKTYWCLILALIWSIRMVQVSHDQSLFVTIIATIPYICGYLFLFTLMKYNLPLERVENTIKWLTIISIFIYIANLLALPGRIFGEEKEEYDMSRGFVRIGVQMVYLVIVYYFYCINKWLVEGKTKWLWWTALTFSLIVMSLTRQLILSSVLLGVFFILKRAAMWKRICLILLCLAIYFIVLPKLIIYQAMVDLSERQIENNTYVEEDIRLRGWHFYTMENQTNNWTYIFGNGVPSMGNSLWGDDFERLVKRSEGGNGCYAVDVTWAGFFWNFGAIATFCLLVIFIKAIMRKKRADKEYLTYALLVMAITAIASGPILVYSHIIQLCIMFYLVFSKRNEEFINGNNNPKLQ